jgi:hypothetical protein
LGAPITRTDALKMLLEFMQKVERIRDARIASYNEQLQALPLDDPERIRIQQARDDWEIMPYDRFLNRAELLAVGSAAVDEIRHSARAEGLDRLPGAEIDAEIQEARRSLTRRR